MPSLKEIRNRISSVSSTMQITSTMKLVSVSKLKKSQDAIVNLQPYTDKLADLIQGLVSGAAEVESPYAQVRPVSKVLLIPITSNRGLCGGYNMNIIKRTLREAAKVENELNAEVQLYSLGKKAHELLSKTYASESFADLHDAVDFAEFSAFAERILSEFKAGEYQEVRFIYTKFVSSAKQVVTVDTFLPVKVESTDETVEVVDYIYEPEADEIVDMLIPQSLKVSAYANLLGSIASEHSARMMAMHQATDNASELKRSLSLTYNKLRQASITNEILEIVGGAEALKN